MAKKDKNTSSKANSESASGKEVSKNSEQASISNTDTASGSENAVSESSEKSLEKSEKTEKLEKAGKKVKMLPAKKLPKLFKKEYSPQAFEKKISKCLFIEPDRLFVEKLFLPAKNAKGQDILKADLSLELPKADIDRYKSLAKQIASQKAGIKFVPLLATVIFVAALVVCFSLFKNVVLKKAIVSSMQGIFQAKTDVEKVDFRFFDSYISIKNLQQANKDSPMKNLFQMDKIIIDFNLTDLTRGKFHAEKIGVEGVAINTDRKTSGELPFKDKTKKTESEIENNEKAEELKKAAQDALLAMFENYNPEKMIGDLQDQLQSPKVATEIAGDVQLKVAKWEKVPGEIEKSVKDFSDDVNKVLKTNWGGIKDVAKLKSALETLNNATKEGNKLKQTIEKTSKEIQVDSKAVAGYQKQLEGAIKADKTLVETKITDVKKLFSPEGLSQMVEEAVQSILYTALGKYSPYMDKAMGIVNGIRNGDTGDVQDELKGKDKDSGKVAENADENAELLAQGQLAEGTSSGASVENTAENSETKKALDGEKTEKTSEKIMDSAVNTASKIIAKNKEKKAKKQPEEKRERLPGRMVYYAADTIPTLFVEEALASGYEYGKEQKPENLLFTGSAFDISNNQDILGKPAKVQADFKIMGNTNSANIVIDARKTSKAPLVTADYAGKGWPIKADASVFSFDSKSDIQAVLTADNSGSFKIGGNVDMKMAGIKGMTFEPERICKLYNDTLSGINALTIGFTVNYSSKNGAQISIDNLDKLTGQIVNPLTKAISAELNTIAVDAKENVTKLLSEKTGIATEKIEAFTNIEGLMNNQKSSMDSLQKQIDAKKRELEKQIKNAGVNVLTGGSTKKAVSGALKGLGF
ncbi:MAG: hypothetical protein K6E78_02935 [Treponema sp.]|nr:hypothetical protein [Treponema sp.]